METVFSKQPWNTTGFYYLKWLTTVGFVSKSYMALIQYRLRINSSEVCTSVILRQLHMEPQNNGVGRAGKTQRGDKGGEKSHKTQVVRQVSSENLLNL